MNIAYILRDREYGKFPKKLSLLDLPDPIEARSDSQCGGVNKLIKSLQNAIKVSKWSDIEYSVGDIMLKLLDNTTSNAFVVTPQKRFQREFFIGFGGVTTLLKLFKKPFGEIDARDITERKMNEKVEVWNEVLVIIRELAIALPSSSEKLFDNDQIVYFFTLLSHSSMFDNTMNLLEEILASRIETFSLGTIPNLFDLLGKFTARQLAHFCRVLSLVLFEPEDRQIMEGAHVLKSIELLQLRRNRMSKNSSGIVERNQSLIIEMPNMLNRLLQIMRVINYGPNLADLISHNIVLQTPITSDILTFISNTIGVSDWDHFSNLENQAATLSTKSSSSSSSFSSNSNRSGITTTETESTLNSSRSTVTESSRASSMRSQSSMSESVGPRSMGTVRVPISFSSSSSSNSYQEDQDDDGDIMNELLSAFSPNQNNNSPIEDSQVFELSNIISVMRVAQNLGIASLTPLGEALLIGQQSAENRRSARNARNRSSSRKGNSPSHCKKELQFHAMLLAPHQIELIFVLCTLLSSRRKINIQKKFAEMGFANILTNMYNRMSWDSPPYNSSENPMEHIHGPGCECNPESAVRVQFLRLIHNFYDRDFLGNINKLQIMSEDEQIMINSAQSSSDVQEFYNNIHEDGLLTKIIITLSKEPVESVYRFWLSACIENFLRGCGHIGQLFVANAGILQTLPQHIITTKPSVNNSLQTSFDLMGEIVKCNLPVLELLEKSLNDTEFRSFVQIIMNNLIDSNVFVRSLYLSLEVISFEKSVHNSLDGEDFGMNNFGFYFNSLSSSDNIFLKQNGQRRLGYLTDSWVQFSPSPISNRAIELFKKSPKTNPLEKSNTNNPLNRLQKEKEVQHKISPSKNKDPKAIFDIDEIPYNNPSSINSDNSSLPPLPSLQRPRALATKHPNNISFSEVSTTTTTSTSFGSGVIGALRDIGRATSNILTRSETKIININDTSEKDTIDNNNISSVINNETGDDFQIESDLFFTPLEEPKFVKTKYSNDINDINENLSNISINENNNKLNAMIEPEDIKNNLNKKNSNGYFIQDSLFRLSIFLVQEKVNILFRLISIVNLRSINHENICCLNTSLLILLFEQKRGNLANILQKIRDLADREYKSANSETENNSSEINESLGSSKIVYCSECGTNASDSSSYYSKQNNYTNRIPYSKSSDRVNHIENSPINKCQDCSNSSYNKIKTKFSSSLFSSKSYCNISSMVSQNTNEDINKGESKKASNLVITNFRELLWYWQEYYLRRGRDRLSIEFSSHIAFENWSALVDLLCKDDGSSTSLLKSPIKLPLSPYQRTFIGSLSSRLLDNNTILFQPF